MFKFIPALLLGFALIPFVEATCPNGKSYPVTLTFDDGPKPGLTQKVLDILKEENIRAIFF
jgi:peptidoglycan/xylan/chitin deacetylase (PgdA/CDA1 family)